MPPSALRLAEPRQRGVLHLERDLEMMAGHRLVIDERAQRELRHALGPQRNLERAGARSVRRRRAVARRRVCLAEPGIRLRDDRRLRPRIELQRCAPLRVAENLLDVRHDGLASVFGERIRLALLERLDPFLERPLRPPELLQDAVHLLLDLGDPLEPDLVNLFRAQVRRRKPPEGERVRVVAALEAPQPRIVVRAAGQRFEERDPPLPRRIDLGGDDLFRLRAQLFPPGIRNRFRRGHGDRRTPSRTGSSPEASR